MGAHHFTVNGACWSKMSKLKTRNQKAPGQITHGMSKTRVFKIWTGITKRCTNPHAQNFKHYGGRGIKMCERWKEAFENFYADMGDPPSASHSLDRIDSDGDYCSENCRWATRITQNNNSKRNHYLSVRGERLTVFQASRLFGLQESCIRRRLKLGWSDEQACGLEYRLKKTHRRSELTK